MSDRLEWEGLLASVAHELPRPVEQETTPDGATVLVGGDPGEVVVRLTRSSASVAEYAVEWLGPGEPAVRPIAIGTIRWRRTTEIHALSVLRTLVQAARESRRAKYRVCGYCEKETPPEWLHDERTCQSCAQAHLGVVY